MNAAQVVLAAAERIEGEWLDSHAAELRVIAGLVEAFTPKDVDEIRAAGALVRRYREILNAPELAAANEHWSRALDSIADKISALLAAR